MKINRPLALLLGIVTLIPYAWFLVLPGYLLPRLMSLGKPGGITSDEYFLLFDRVYVAGIGIVLLTIAIGGIYVLHVFYGSDIPKAARSRWTALLLFLGFFTMPVYWYRHVWRPSVARAA